MPSTKKISFNDHVIVHPLPDRSTNMTPIEKSQAYYSKEELREFQLERILICNKVIQQARSLSKFNPAVSPAKNVSLILKSNTSLRGFEALLCPTRKSNKTMVLEAVRDYQHRLNGMKNSFSLQQNEVALADLYAKLSYWSKMLALLIARNDRMQLCKLDVERDIMFVPGSPIPSEIKFDSIPNIVSPILERKRTCSVTEEQHTRTRCRIF